MKDTILNNFSLEKIAWVIKKRIILIVLITIITAACAGFVGFFFGQTLYTASISLYVYGSDSFSDSSYSVSSTDFTMAKNLVPSYMLVLKSDTVLSEIVEELSIDYTVDELRDRITSNAVEDTAVFYVSVNDSDPYMAMNVANSIADVASSAIASVVRTGGVQVLDHASLPSAPSSESDPVMYALIGGGASFAIMLIVFITMGLMDTTVRNKKELVRTFDVPILGDVPMIVSPTKKIKIKKVLSTSSPFAVKESYNAIRTNLLFTATSGECPVYAVTSVDKGDGKTTNCVNLAISYSMLGKKTLIIDADMRDPSIGKTLEVDRNVVGLSQYLAGISKTINIQKSDIDNLSFLQAGAIPPNPAELLAMERFDTLLSTLKSQFDCIFIDLPPVGAVSDAMLIADKVTDYIIVVRSYSSKLTALYHVLESFERIEAKVGGFILNGVNPKSREYSQKYYNYEYKAKS